MQAPDIGLRERLVRATLILSVTLGSLLNRGGVTTLQRAAVLVILAIGAVLALTGGRPRTSPGRATTLWAFVACVVVSFLRFAAAPILPITARTMIGLALMLMLVTVLGFCALLAPPDIRIFERRLRCVLFAPVCFVALNLGLYVLGFSFPTTPGEPKGSNGQSQLLSLIGVHGGRVNLPLNPGVNGGGEMAGLALVICVVLAYRGGRKQQSVAILGAIVSLVTVFLTDSRGALVFALLTLALVTILPRWTKRVVVIIPTLLPIAPAIILFALGQLASFSAVLSRNEGDFVTATGRQAVWSVVLKFLGHPHAQDLIGYGAYGQVRSGVGFQYSYVFPGLLHPQFATAHNIALQTILDMGYVGLAIFLIFLMVSINSARLLNQRIGTPESTALLAALIALSLLGADEAFPGLAGIYLLLSLIVLACAAIRVLEPARSRATTSDPAIRDLYLTGEASNRPARPQIPSC